MLVLTIDNHVDFKLFLYITAYVVSFYVGRIINFMGETNDFL